MSEVKKLAEKIVGLSALDLAELSSTVQDMTGVKPSAMAVAAAPAAAEAVEEKTDFTVMLTSFGDKKLQVIKTVRELTGLGLKEAKELVESVPAAIKENAPKDEAEAAKTKLTDAGGTVELK